MKDSEQRLRIGTDQHLSVVKNSDALRKILGLKTSCATSMHTHMQGGHGTGKTGNLVLTFSRQGKHREFCSDTGKNLLTQGKYLDCDY